METQNIFEQLKKLEGLIIRGSKGVYTAPEAAMYLGIGLSYLYKLTAARKLAYFKPEGKQIYFQRESLDSYLLRNRVSSSEELQDKATSFVTSRKKGGRK